MNGSNFQDGSGACAVVVTNDGESAVPEISIQQRRANTLFVQM